MLDLKIAHYGPIHRAEITSLDPSGITVIAGRNSRGKSHVLKALACLATGTSQPGGIAKKDAGALVSAGSTATAVIHLTTRHGEEKPSQARIKWPECSFETAGTPFQLSSVAAGFVHPVDQPIKERVKAFGDLIGATPSHDDLAAMLEQELDTNNIALLADAVWDDIEERGWDGAYDKTGKQSTTLKGQWKQAAGGETYGSQKAANWRPAGWSMELEGINEATLTAAIAYARSALDDMLRHAGAGDAERQRLEREAADYDAAHAAIAAAATAVNAAKDGHDATTRAKAALPPATEDAGIPCPCCGGKVVVRGGGAMGPHILEKAADGALSSDELKKRRLALASADGKLAAAKSVLDAAERDQRAATARFQAAKTARDAIAKLPPAEGGDGDDAEIERARDRVATAEINLRMAKQVNDAAAIHALIVENEAVRKVLAPDGLRQSRLALALDDFNADLRRLTDAAKWPVVEIRHDMAIAADGRDYDILGGLGPALTSLQFRARVVIQVAIAGRLGDPMVLIDAADVLDAGARSGLIKLLRAAGLGAMIAMTYPNADTAAKLGPYTGGPVFWVDAGTVTEIYRPTSVSSIAAE